MPNQQERNEAKQLEKLIQQAASAYYNAQPIISDEEFDNLCERLRRLAPQSKVLQQVGAPPTSALQKKRHSMPMYSLDKVKTEGEYNEWVRRLVLGDAPQLIVEEKLDGISVELVYENGRFIHALTRGDGETGEDISHTVRHMINFKNGIPSFSGSLRGEIILRKSVFREFFSDYKNPRNAAAGFSRRIECDQRVCCLEILYYDVLEKDGQPTEKRKLQRLKKLGCETVNSYVCTDATEWWLDYCNSTRESLDYEIDGLVIKVNNVAAQAECGVVGGRPKGQIAWKFPAQQVWAGLRNVVWQVGLTGRITPVAILEPIQLGGVRISRVSLHNLANFRKLALSDQSEVLVSRRNDVIPYIEKSKINAFGCSGHGLYAIPNQCPVCADTTTERGDFLMCMNALCPSRTANDLMKWVEVLGLKDLGEAFLNDCINKLGVQALSDLYLLTIDQLLALPGYKEKKAEKLIARIQSSKKLSFEAFLAALNIPGIGKSTWSGVQQAGFGLEKLLNTQPASLQNELLSVPNVGLATAEAIVSGLQQRKDTIEKLLAVGVQIEEKAGPLKGMSFCFTGALPSGMARGVAHRIVEKQGGTIKTSVSRGLTYLVQADPKSSSTKSQKAVAFGTKVISEDEFFELAKFDVSMLSEI